MNTVASGRMYKSRLSSKLLILFALVFFGVVVGGFVLDLFANLLTAQNNRALVASQPPTLVIDPKLETELAKVMSMENIQTTADLKDPFLDRSGISQAKGAPLGSAVRNSTTTTPNSARTTTAAATKNTNVPGRNVNPAVQNQPGTNVAVVKEDTLTRITKRDENIRNGIPVGPESEIFAIEDLLPVGVVSGGNGQDEILLYSQSADRTFSYPVGTRFYDGWLSGIRNEGAVFTFNETKVVSLKSWVRSIQPRSPSGAGSSNQPGTTGGN